MDDVAKLGLEVDSSGLDKGSEKLERFSKTADDAAKSADNFNKTASGGTEKVKQAATAQAAAFDEVKTAVAGMSEAQLGAATVIGALTVAAAAAAATAGVLAYNWSDAQEKVSQSLIGIGAKTGETIQSLNKFSVANASATGLSIAQARDVATEFNKTGAVAVSGLKGLGDTVQGYSILTGQTATKATQTLAKAFTGDLKGAVDIAANSYGAMNGAIRDQVDALLLVGDRTSAAQVIINAMAGDNKKAEESVGLLTKAWNLLGNTVSAVANLPAFNQSLDPNQRLAAARGNQNAGQNPQIGSNPGGYGLLNTGALHGGDIANLQKEAAAFNADKINKQLNSMAEAGNAVVKSIIPEIDQIDKLKQALATLQDAQNAPGVGPLQGSTGAQDQNAVTAIQNQIAALQEAQVQAANYNQQVAQISQAWGNVGQSVALQLQTMQNALPVAEAWTNATRMRAQEEATYLNLIQKGRTEEEASAVAAKQYELSKASAVANGEKLVQSSQDNLDKVRAQGTGMEGVVASSIAYRDAIQSGATAMQANAIAANTLAASLAQAAQSQQQIDNSTAQYNAQLVAAQGGSQFNPMTMPRQGIAIAGGGSVSYAGGVAGKRLDAGVDAFNILKLQQQSEASGIASLAGAAFAQGGASAALAAIMNAPNSFGSSDGAVLPGSLGQPLSSILGPAQSTISDKVSAYDSIVQIQNSLTSNKGEQGANIQNELAWLKTLPPDSSVAAKVKELTDALNGLTSSTDGLNSTNQELLSPYYTQDPRTSHIGFRSQGMATGGEITIPGGYSANDNMFVNVPVASGEILSVRRPGQSSGGGGPNVTISMPVTIQGSANKDDIGRTLYQSAQVLARQVAAAGR